MSKDILFSKTIELGKIAYSYKNRKCNVVELTVEIKRIASEKGIVNIYNWDTLKLIGEEKVISISGGVWNHMHTDYIMGGQCLDDLMKLMPDNEVLKVVHPIWKEYHLNDTKAGSRQQTEALQAYFAEIGEEYNYNKAVEYLQLIGLYKDRGCQYGSSWLLKPVPEDVVKQLIQVCDPVPQL